MVNKYHIVLFMTFEINIAAGVKGIYSNCVVKGKSVLLTHCLFTDTKANNCPNFKVSKVLLELSIFLNPDVWH